MFVYVTESDFDVSCWVNPCCNFKALSVILTGLAYEDRYYQEQKEMQTAEISSSRVSTISVWSKKGRHQFQWCLLAAGIDAGDAPWQLDVHIWSDSDTVVLSERSVSAGDASSVVLSIHIHKDCLPCRLANFWNTKEILPPRHQICWPRWCGRTVRSIYVLLSFSRLSYHPSISRHCARDW